MAANVSLRVKVEGLNHLLSQLYEREIRASTLLARQGFSAEQVEEIQGLHAQPLTQAIIDHLCARVLSFSNGNARRSLLLRRFGLDGHPPATLEAVGQFLSLNEETTRDLERRALRACRRNGGLVELEDLLLLQAAALVGQPESEPVPFDPHWYRLPPRGQQAVQASRPAHIDTPNGKSYSVEEIRKVHGRAYAPWSKTDDERLLTLSRQGVTLPELARIFERKEGAIRSRLRKLVE